MLIVILHALSLNGAGVAWAICSRCGLCLNPVLCLPASHRAAFFLRQE
ncbi:hypothetical protein BN1182_CN_00010 [Pantoea ananatis]|nr:hypothetical protein BN1182_CN_00010 [Pantoea ananatis]